MNPIFKPKISEMTQSIQPCGSFTPFEKAADPGEWRTVGVSNLQEIIRSGEDASVKELPRLPIALYREYAMNGNRSRFQSVYYERRKILCNLILAEAAERKGRFVKEICEGIWQICEETTWVIPAHNKDPVTGDYLLLPQRETRFVDLFSAETGAFLAVTVYLLGDNLEEEIPGIIAHIIREVKARILTPYMERDDFWWMNFREGTVINNWNPWCNSNILLCLLLLEDDEIKRRFCAEKVMRSLDIFVESYPDDGSCDEGPGYWARAGASLFECLEYLSLAGLESYNLFAFPGLRKMGEYICDMRIGGNWFVNFADAAPKVLPPPGLLYRFGKRTGSSRLVSLARLMAPISDREGYRNKFGTSLMRDIAELFTFPEIYKEQIDDSLPVHAWYPDGQVMISRETPRGGLFLAAKGGGNGDSHNHNDVGQFIVFKDQNPIIVDVGVEAYTAKTFSSSRYEIWTMRSVFHNLPEINGHEQLPGPEYQAQDLIYSREQEGEALSMDISGAYSPDSGIREWFRSFRYSRDVKQIVITDTFSLSGDPRSIIWYLMTTRPPELLEDREIRLGTGSRASRCRVSGIPVNLAFEEISISGSTLEKIWGKKLFRIIISARESLREGSLTFLIS